MMAGLPLTQGYTINIVKNRYASNFAFKKREMYNPSIYIVKIAGKNLQ